MSQSVKRTFAVFVEDKPGVLNRVASLFRRRSFNIDSLNVGATQEAGVIRPQGMYQLQWIRSLVTMSPETPSL